MTDSKQLIERLRAEAKSTEEAAEFAAEEGNERLRDHLAVEAALWRDAAKEISELREALKPFISELRYERDNNPEIDAMENDQEISITVLLGDLRHARDICRARAKLEGSRA